MHGSEERIDFHRMVEEIEEDRLLLPDFQRRFAWTDAGDQVKLVASALCRMPLGSILLLNTSAMDFAARRIGSNIGEELFLEREPRDFLLDGQQRVTILVNAFSDLIHENGGAQIDSLKRRFFLGVPKGENLEAEDPFGFRRLMFPMEDPENDIPEFMTETVADAVIVRNFRNEEPAAYNPCCDSGRNLLSFCLGYDGYYLIPLYLLVKRREIAKRDKNLRLLRAILQCIAGEQARSLAERLPALGESAEDRPGEFMPEALQDGKRRGEQEAEYLAGDWAVKMERYLDSCIRRMFLHIIGTPNSNRAKAIEIFEYLNRGGARLSTFDMVMARAARADRSIRKHLREECGRLRPYPAELVPEKVRRQFELYTERRERENQPYHALRELGCMGGGDGELSRRLQDAFLNVLSLRVWDKKAGRDSRRYRSEYGRSGILRLEAEEIEASYREVCEALDRAAFFLNVRCGVRNLSEVSYHLMFTVLAYILMEREIYESRKAWNLLTAWYWCAVFSGRYDRDQNVQAERDIGYLWDVLHGRGHMGYIRDMYDKAFNMPLFSSKSFLLYRDSGESRVYPKDVLGRYLCRYYLVDGYPDMFDRSLRVCAFPYVEELEELERHHIVPLMSSQSIRESEQSLAGARGRRIIQNSPLNFCYITRKANRRIGSQNVADYMRELECGAARELGLLLPKGECREADIEDILGNRYEWVKGKLRNDIQAWIGLEEKTS